MNIRNLKDQPLDEIQVKKAGRQIKGFLIWLLKVVIIVGISYIKIHGCANAKATFPEEKAKRSLFQSSW